MLRRKMTSFKGEMKSVNSKVLAEFEVINKTVSEAWHVKNNNKCISKYLAFL